MTKERLREIKARADLATPGEWIGNTCHISQLTDKGLGKQITERVYELSDSLFICHARQDVPDLLAYVAELHGKLDELLAMQVTGGDSIDGQRRAYVELPERIKRVKLGEPLKVTLSANYPPYDHRTA